MQKQRISNCRYPVSAIVVETTSPKARKKYSHLYTDLGYEPEQLFYKYNQRQSIESLIKEDKNGLYIDTLRTRKYFGILSFLYLAVMTYNLLSLFRYHVLKGTELESLSVIDLTNNLMDIPAKIRADKKQLTLAFPENHKFCKKYFNGHNHVVAKF